MFKSLFELLDIPTGQCKTRNGYKCSTDKSYGKDFNGEWKKKKKKISSATA